MESQYQIDMAADVAKKQQYADQCNAGTAPGYSPQVESLSQQIGRRIQRESDNLSNLYRAKDILQRHPEFEELAWLIRSGRV